MEIEKVRRVDRQDMWGAVRDFPRQWQEGRAAAAGVDLGFSAADKRQVVVAGMGGSAIGGDLLAALARDHARVPVTVTRHYSLPASVGSDSVVIVSSYSGNTEETNAALREALERGAAVACIASGGEVRAAAERHGLPFVQVPGGLQPRAALGYSLTALLSLAEAMDLLALKEAAWAEAQEVLEEQGRELADLAGNQALELARALTDRLPVVYSSTGLMGPVGLRWRNQIQENAKKLAVGNEFPELNHNEIMGWDVSSPFFDRMAVVVLRDAADHPRVQRRMEITRGLLGERAGAWIEVESRGRHDLARVLSLVNLGDWVSLYLALLRDVDPTPVGMIERLKEAL